MCFQHSHFGMAELKIPNVCVVPKKKTSEEWNQQEWWYNNAYLCVGGSSRSVGGEGNWWGPQPNLPLHSIFSSDFGHSILEIRQKKVCWKLLVSGAKRYFQSLWGEASPRGPLWILLCIYLLFRSLCFKSRLAAMGAGIVFKLGSRGLRQGSKTT